MDGANLRLESYQIHSIAQTVQIMLETGTSKINLLQILIVEIQKIQTFLVCSEYFDSSLVRNFYEFMSDRQSRALARVQRLVLGEEAAVVEAHTLTRGDTDGAGEVQPLKLDAMSALHLDRARHQDSRRATGAP
jgi:hypothetical protein